MYFNQLQVYLHHLSMKKLFAIILIVVNTTAYAFDFETCRNWAMNDGNSLGFALKIKNIARSITSNLKSIENETGSDSETSREILKYSAHRAFSLENQLLYLSIVMIQSFSSKVSEQNQSFINETISSTF